MALNAIAGYAGVIERGAQETRRGMAQVALLCRRNVVRWFAPRRYTVVAT